MPIAVIDPDPSWPAQFDELADRIRGALGGRVLALEHVGSTSVPDLPAKPIIDIDLVVTDSSDEAAYVPALEQIGFVLLVREPGWHQHRLMVATSPPANLHVFSPDSPEVIRHRMFRDWLRDHPDDRVLYTDAKRGGGRRVERRRRSDAGVQPAQTADHPRDPRPHVSRPRHVVIARWRTPLNRIVVRGGGFQDW